MAAVNRAKMLTKRSAELLTCFAVFSSRVVDSFRSHRPKLAAPHGEPESDVLVYVAFPSEHWRLFWNSNPVERLNHEVKRNAHAIHARLA